MNFKFSLKKILPPEQED